tara:strand:+ start:191 stop:583 length:393 start_codon:yes stop_codon:yes gene_type:complete
MNMTQANEALANYQHYALTQYTLDLHDIAEHGAYGINEVRTMRDVIALIRVIKQEVRRLGEILISHGGDPGMSAIRVKHESLDCPPMPKRGALACDCLFGRMGVQFSVYDSDNDPEHGVEAVVRKHWDRV